MTSYKAFWKLKKIKVKRIISSHGFSHLLCFTEPWTDKQLERLFLFSMMWSLGALLELNDREKMEEFILAHPSKLDWPKCRENETIFEYLVAPENGRWQHWSERVEDFVYPPDRVLDYNSILVPNVDNVRTGYLIQTIAKQSKAVLLTGEQVYQYWSPLTTY